MATPGKQSTTYSYPAAGNRLLPIAGYIEELN